GSDDPSGRAAPASSASASAPAAPPHPASSSPPAHRLRSLVLGSRADRAFFSTLLVSRVRSSLNTDARRSSPAMRRGRHGGGAGAMGGGRAEGAVGVAGVGREAVEQGARRPEEAPALAQRARLVLACAAGGANPAVGQRLGGTMEAGGKWRARFVGRRLDG